MLAGDGKIRRVLSLKTQGRQSSISNSAAGSRKALDAVVARPPLTWEEQVQRTKNEEPLERTVPDPSLQLKSGVLEKLCADDEWQMRRLVVSAKAVMITRPNSDMIIDSIPLYEVEVVARNNGNSDEDDDNPRKSRNKVSLQPSMNLRNSKHAKLQKQDLSEGDLMFEISTVAGGFNSGRTYYFRTQSSTTCDDWIRELKNLVKEARVIHDRLSRMVKLQGKVRKIYASTPTQTFIALLILGNFVASAFETQLNPDTVSGLDAFRTIDLMFTVLFTVELAVNAFAHWFWPFISDGWNFFDICVVVASILSIVLETASGIKGLRMIRAFRVIRVVRRLANLRSIINSLTASVVPVINAMMIVFLTCCIYAVIGVNLFRDTDALLFGTFARALFTMFQVSTLDGWARASRSMFESDDLDPGVTIFFMSFIVITTWTLLPVVVAVLLDNFHFATKKEKERAEELRLAKKKGPTVAHALDPLLASMMHYGDDADLARKIATLYKILDSDNKGSLGYEDMVESFKKIPAYEWMHMSQEDYQNFTEDYRLCDDSHGLTLGAFEYVVRSQMKLYLFRQMDVAVRLSEDEDMATSLLLSGMKILIQLVDKSTAAPQPFLPRASSSMANPAEAKGESLAHTNGSAEHINGDKPERASERGAQDRSHDGMNGRGAESGKVMDGIYHLSGRLDDIQRLIEKQAEHGGAKGARTQGRGMTPVLRRALEQKRQLEEEQEDLRRLSEQPLGRSRTCTPRRKARTPRPAGNFLISEPGMGSGKATLSHLSSPRGLHPHPSTALHAASPRGLHPEPLLQQGTDGGLERASPRTSARRKSALDVLSNPLTPRAPGAVRSTSATQSELSEQASPMMATREQVGQHVLRREYAAHEWNRPGHAGRAAVIEAIVSHEQASMERLPPRATEWVEVERDIAGHHSEHGGGWMPEAREVTPNLHGRLARESRSASSGPRRQHADGGAPREPSLDRRGRPRLSASRRIGEMVMGADEDQRGFGLMDSPLQPAFPSPHHPAHESPPRASESDFDWAMAPLHGPDPPRHDGWHPRRPPAQVDHSEFLPPR